MFDDKLLTI